MSSVSSAITVLCVCTFNRTRSVMTAALLEHHLAVTGIDAVVTSAGTRADGGPPTGETVSLLAKRGLDVRAHRGTPLSNELVAGADLIVTAEPDHVVVIAGRWPQSFASTFTLPEIVHRSQVHGGRLGASLDDWRDLLNTHRPTGLDYLDDPGVGTIDDPTGRDRHTWATTIDQINDLTRRLAVLLG